LSLRKKIQGSGECPRICTTKSSKHLKVQVVDDVSHKILFSVQTFGKNTDSSLKKNEEGAKKIGIIVAEKLKENKISRAVFDRNGFKYFGLIAAVAQSIRENGVQI
jgi:large subunit ribosomal protein L18